jgi:superfamily II DNA or RNA helicase
LRLVFTIDADVLTGDLSKADREAVVARLEAGQVKVLIATGQLIGEGFDCKGLTTLFLATPIKFDGRLLQYVGRIMRPAPGKERARVYDYVDGNVGVLAASARTRQRVYERQASTGG